MMRMAGAVNKKIIREWVESIVVAFILAMFIRTFFIQAFKIPSGSMRVTLMEGDRLMVNKLRYGPKVPLTRKRLPGFSTPQRGDIIFIITIGAVMGWRGRRRSCRKGPCLFWETTADPVTTAGIGDLSLRR